MALRDKKRSAAAYTLVDLSELPEDVRKDVMEDAAAGGGEYGLRIVEESVNGGARAAVYGYYFGVDEDKWSDAKKDLGISHTEIDDGAVAGAGMELDPRREAAIREAAAQQAAAEADRIRSGEDRELAAITGAVDGHAVNIVDTTLAKDATNNADNVGADGKPLKPSKNPK